MGQINNLMIDIETLGTKSNSVIMSIGAVMFDIETGEVGETFRADIDPETCVNAGLKIDASTVIWWLGQEREAQQDLIKGGKRSLEYALTTLSAFISKYAPDVIWGNGVRFDLGLLENAYNALNMKAPWPFWVERDVRTLVSFRPDIKNEFINDLPHTPVNDCLYQIKYCSAIWRNIAGT